MSCADDIWISGLAVLLCQGSDDFWVLWGLDGFHCGVKFTSRE